MLHLYGVSLDLYFDHNHIDMFKKNGSQAVNIFTVILSSIFPMNITIKSNIMQIGDLFE